MTVANERRTKTEAGVVMVWSAIFMLALLAFVGLALDVGNWYLQAAKLQRAVDAAALAGAAKMPDRDAAVTAAIAALAKNHYVAGPDVTITATPEPGNRVAVSVTTANVRTAFASWIVDHISLTRTARGEFRNPLAMGNPGNVLGSGTLAFSGNQYQSGNYWLAVNGYCTSAEDGDPLSSRYDGNKLNGLTKCDETPGLEKNPNYNWNGYDYLVSVPMGAGNMTLSVYDAGYADGLSGPNGLSPDNTGAQPNDPTAHITTSYTLYDTSNSPGPATDVLIAHVDFVSSSLPGCAVSDWCDVGPTLLPGHKYRLNVHTLQGEPNSWGVNAFSLMVHPLGSQESVSACDTRRNNLCPQIYAANALSMFVNFTPGSNEVELYLANVDVNYAGEKMIISLWDPGEGGESVRLLAPNNDPRPFKWQAVKDANGTLNGVASSLSVAGVGTSPGPNRTGEGRFNDRAVVIETVVPPAYETMLDANGSGWWKVDYNINAGSPPHDRTTWTARVQDQSPVRLIK